MAMLPIRMRKATSPHRHSARSHVGLVMMVLLAIPLCGFGGNKTDTIIFDNGDRITCEIRILQQGRLTVKTNYSRAMELDWRAVQRITSPQYFKVTLEDGRRVFGTLVDGGEDGILAVKLLESVQHYPLLEVTGLAPIEQGFFRKLSGSVNVGVTALKANTERTLNVGTKTTYRSEKWYANAAFDWYTSTRDESPDTSQGSLGASAFRLYGRHWAAVSSASFARNDELDLLLRMSLSGGAGYRILETNSKFFIAMAGFNATQEKYGTSTGSSFNLEGLLSVSYNTFTFRQPQVTFNVDFTVYPSFTTSGRYRAALNSNLNYEVISDFFVGFSATFSFDSKPPSTVGSKSDWTLTTTIGYKFHQ